MKNSHTFQSIQYLVFIGLLAQSTISFGQQAWRQKAQQTYKGARTETLKRLAGTREAAQRTLAQAKEKGRSTAARAKQKFSASKQRAAQLTQREINTIKLGLEATQKKVKGQSLTPTEIAAMGTLAKYSAAVIAMTAVAAGIGASIYLGTRKDESELPPTLPATYEEKLLTHIREGLTQKEKDLILQMYTFRDEPWYQGIKITKVLYDAAQTAPLVEFKEESFTEAVEDARGKKPVDKPIHRFQP